MSVFTLEAAGQPVACIGAKTLGDAEEWSRNGWLREQLCKLSASGSPLWDGSAALTLRAATAMERALVERREGEPPEGTGTHLPTLFLSDDPVRVPGDHELILASRVEHTPVFNTEGERIGHIEDLSIDRQDGTVIYAIMSFGSFLGIGKKFHPLPWSLLAHDAERGGYVVALDKDQLKSAPFYDYDDLHVLGGARRDISHQHILTYYGPFGPPMI